MMRKAGLVLHLGQIVERIRSGDWRGSLAESSSSKVVGAEQLCELLDEISPFLEPVNAGDRVLLHVENSISSVAAMLALWERGAVVVPVRASLSEASLEKLAMDCNARFTLCPVEKTLKRTDTCEVTPSATFPRRIPRSTGNDLALIIYTSGSTGTPKGIMLTHANVLAALHSIVEYLQLDASDTVLSICPLTFDYGLYQVLFSLVCDSTTVIYDEYVQPLAVIRAIKRHGVTVLPVVPALGSAIVRMLKSRKIELPGLGKLTNTGGHLTEKTIRDLRDALPNTAIYAMYGLTECKRALYLPPEDAERKVGSVGIPIPGMDAAVIKRIETGSGSSQSEKFVEAQPNEIGELFVRGMSVMQGYTREEPEAGARIVHGRYRDDTWLATGDLFLCDEEGYFYFKGRIKELIKQGGYCIYPFEVEKELTAHPLVENAAVVGAVDSNGLELARAFVKLSTSSVSARHEVRTWLETRIEPEFRPREIMFVERMPTSTNGKVDKGELLRSVGEASDAA